MSRVSIDVLFENKYWLVVSKPPGLLTVRGREWGATQLRAQSEPDSLRPNLIDELCALYGTVLPVHRLDREVSGVILVARNRESQVLGNQWFEKKVIRKKYQALCESTNITSMVTQSLPRDIHFRMRRGKKRSYIVDHGQEAMTSVTAIQIKSQYTSFELEPKTGRSHQLRLTMAHYYAPILGDILYGADESRSRALGYHQDRIALRAVLLDFAAITSNQRLGLPESIGCDELT